MSIKATTTAQCIAMVCHAHHVAMTAKDSTDASRLVTKAVTKLSLEAIECTLPHGATVKVENSSRGRLVLKLPAKVPAGFIRINIAPTFDGFDADAPMLPKHELSREYAAQLSRHVTSVCVALASNFSKKG